MIQLTKGYHDTDHLAHRLLSLNHSKDSQVLGVVPIIAQDKSLALARHPANKAMVRRVEVFDREK